jgi:hypothetical protein
MRRVVIAVLALGVLTGCGATHTDAKTSHAPVASTATPAPTPTPTVAAAPLPTAPANTPLGAGQRVWAAFSAGTLPYAAWWAGLKPLLSDAARAVYVYDDPRNIPALTLTAPISLAAKAPAEPHYTAEVTVSTSKGVFALDLERHTLKSPWLLYAMKFPPSVQ